MKNSSITIRDAVYIVTIIISMLTVYFKMDAKVYLLETVVTKHSKSFETYNLAVFQYQLDDIQEDVKDIKTLIENQHNGAN